jgi:hypothetical protein
MLQSMIDMGIFAPKSRALVAMMWLITLKCIGQFSVLLVNIRIVCQHSLVNTALSPLAT